MFCDRCGHPVREDAQFCSACGKQLAPSPVPPPAPVAVAVGAPDGRVVRHLKILASLWLVYALLRLMHAFSILVLGRIFLPGLVSGVMSNGPWAREWPFGGFPLDRLISGGLVLAGFWIGAFAVLEIVTAWGLFDRRPWARILALVLGFLAILSFPFGTALGIYTLWVLLPGPAGQEYDRLAHSHQG
jgi:hypothetical protein